LDYLGLCWIIHVFYLYIYIYYLSSII
jgi:hypothetical protein